MNQQTDIGTIVDIHNGGEAYTVEFIDENGETIEEAFYTEFTESEWQTHIKECVRKDTRGMRRKARRADKNHESGNRGDEKSGKLITDSVLIKEKVHLLRSAFAERYRCFDIQWQQIIRRCL